MSYGFQVVGDGGVVTVDQDFTNYALYSKTVITNWTGGNWATGGGTAYSQDVPVPTGDYVVALATTTDSYASILGQGRVMAFTTTAAATPVVTAYVFSRPTQSSDTHGLRVWRADGSLAFDAGLKYMRVVDAVYAPGANTPISVQTYTYASGSLSGSYAVLQAPSRQLVSNTAGNPGNFLVFRDWYSTRTDGFVLRLSHFIGGPGNVSGFSDQTNGGLCLVLDVGGY